MYRKQTNFYPNTDYFFFMDMLITFTFIYFRLLLGWTLT